jgi:hypothetical protein
MTKDKQNEYKEMTKQINIKNRNIKDRAKESKVE